MSCMICTIGLLDIYVILYLYDMITSPNVFCDKYMLSTEQYLSAIFYLPAL